MQTIIFDIETGPLPESELSALLPAFDPAEVKTGNIKDPEKVAAKIAEAEANHRQDFFDRAALDPLTGRVLAIGLIYSDNQEFVILGHEDERQILLEFWNACRGDMGRVHQLIGFNTHLFDLPFLIRRSWKHRIAIPFGVRRGRYWSDEMVDLRELWQLGDRQAHGSLKTIARHLAVGAKPGDGNDFAALWKSNRPEAEAYLRNDIELTAAIAGLLADHV